MIQKRFAAASLLALSGPLSGCLAPRATVRVLDKDSLRPVAGAVVTPIHPSINGSARRTNTRGVARIGGFGLSPVSFLDVTAPGYQRLSVPVPEGNVNRLEVGLQPARTPGSRSTSPHYSSFD